MSIERRVEAPKPESDSGPEIEPGIQEIPPDPVPVTKITPVNPPPLTVPQEKHSESPGQWTPVPPFKIWQPLVPGKPIPEAA